MNNITKKAYVKPDIALVDFSLSSSIAAACAIEVNGTFEENGCKTGYVDNGFVVFEDFKTCEIPNTDPNVCYHTPNDETRVFGS